MAIWFAVTWRAARGRGERAFRAAPCPRGDGPAERRELVVAAPVVAALRPCGVGDELQFGQPRDRRVKRPGAEAHLAAGPFGDVEDQPVAVPVLVGEAEQDVELLGAEGQKALHVGRRHSRTSIRRV
jgi:hypothetical protein